MHAQYSGDSYSMLSRHICTQLATTASLQDAFWEDADLGWAKCVDATTQPPAIPDELMQFFSRNYTIGCAVTCTLCKV